MKSLPSSALVDLSIKITWKNNGISHQEQYYVEDLNCWRDALPGGPVARFLEKEDIPQMSAQFAPGTLVPAYDPGRIVKVPPSRLNIQGPEDFRPGRFYPQGILSGIPSIFRENMNPFRCIAIDAKGITADLNHPMARFPIALTLKIENRSMKPEERGGACRDVLEEALTGPGMQTRYGSVATDYTGKRGFSRRDRSPDSKFYEKDRLVRHIDERASTNVSRIYQGLVAPGGRVLDLMASVESHLPQDMDLGSVHGIGLNANELMANPRLDSYSIQDLNADPRLDMADHTFDAVVCALSVEYLVAPVRVFNEVFRVLKPGGRFIVVFSNRWFPEKTIRIWEQLHDFERMGLVMEYLGQTRPGLALSTWSMRGYPRPFTDKYYPRLKTSDPVYAVAAEKPYR